jgi:hypothetical protein
MEPKRSEIIAKALARRDRRQSKKARAQARKDAKAPIAVKLQIFATDGLDAVLELVHATARKLRNIIR